MSLTPAAPGRPGSPLTAETDGDESHGRDVMSKRRKKRKPPAPSRFKVGDRVWVRHGVREVDHPDIPLGGWAGTISEVHKHGMYSVHWSRETLASIHPIYRKRCAIDGTDAEEYWLAEEDLESDPGGPLAMEQPAQITPRPLSSENQGDRVRMVFGLTSDDFLPGVDEDSLETYYDFLEERLSLPLEARYWNQADFFHRSPLRWVKVVALDRELGWTEDEGILCEVRTAEEGEVLPLADLHLRRSDPNSQLVDDFATWFFGELCEEVEDGGDGEESYDDDELDEEDEEDIAAEATWRSVALLMLEITAFAASYGAVMGAALAVMPWARWAACIGGGLLGVFVAVAQVASAQKEMAVISPGIRKGFAGFVGLVTGGVQGAFFGVMAVAFIGAILGGIVGLLLRRTLGGTRKRFFQVFPGSVLLAAACGVAGQAFYMNQARAAEGLLFGASVGLGTVLCFGLVGLPLSFLIVKRV